MQTAPNTDRYLVTKRGAKSAILLGDLRVFDTEGDAREYVRTETEGKKYHWFRLFRVSNDKRPKEINLYEDDE